MPTRINPTPGRSIHIQSYDGTDIPNSIDLDPTRESIEFNRQNISMARLVQAGIRILGPSTGRYNCHGLVFGSRRTNIPPAGLSDAVSIDDLLRRDCYTRVFSAPHPGNVVVYRGPTTEIEHTGYVSRVEKLGNTDIVFVLSKWGAFEECEHRETLGPYGNCRIEYWRLIL
jgi:hypothetical protein